MGGTELLTVQVRTACWPTPTTGAFSAMTTGGSTGREGGREGESDGGREGVREGGRIKRSPTGYNNDKNYVSQAELSMVYFNVDLKKDYEFILQNLEVRIYSSKFGSERESTIM